jgi:CheY-like chemotaxis protein/Tfp pilus assembly protein PilZ
VEGNVLVVGDFSSESQESIIAACKRSSMEANFTHSFDSVLSSVKNRKPDAVFISCESSIGKATCNFLALGIGDEKIPMFGLTKGISELNFGEFLSWGGHDVLDISDIDGLVPRLRAVRKLPVSFKGTTLSRGRALVADLDEDRSAMTSKVMRLAGYDVTLTKNSIEAERIAMEGNISLMVIDVKMSPASGIDIITKLSKFGKKIPTILCAPPKFSKEERRYLSEFAHVIWHDSFSPPHNLMFLANKLMDTHIESLRAHPRLLYGTCVWFRKAGQEEDTIGLTYNVSEGGVFIATMMPLETGEIVWLELTPPRAERRVRLEGISVWINGFGPNGKATAPPGVGVCVVDGSKNDLERYREGCKMLGAELGM